MITRANAATKDVRHGLAKVPPVGDFRHRRAHELERYAVRIERLCECRHYLDFFFGDDSLTGNCFARHMAKKRYRCVALSNDRSSHGQLLPDCLCNTIDTFASPEPGNGPDVEPIGPYRIDSTSR